MRVWQLDSRGREAVDRTVEAELEEGVIALGRKSTPGARRVWRARRSEIASDFPAARRADDLPSAPLDVKSRVLAELQVLSALSKALSISDALSDQQLLCSLHRR